METFAPILDETMQKAGIKAMEKRNFLK